MGWWLVGAAIVASVVAVWRARRRHGRARSLMLLCRRADLEYSPVDPFPDTLWLPFRWLGEGRWARSENVVWNRAEGDDVRAFDLSVEEPPSREDLPGSTRRYSCATVSLGSGCPRFEIVPRDLFGDAAEAFGSSEVEFELEAFNRRFRVRSADRRFAVAFCDQRMMRAMLELPPGVTIAVNEDRMLFRASILPPAEVLLLFEAARTIRRLVPPVVTSLYPPRPAKGKHEDRWLQGRWSPEPIGDDDGGTAAAQGGRR
jgi:hypothetical protein